MRPRSSLLEAFEVLKDLNPGVTLHQVMAFLYVAEEEGLMVRDVMERGEFSQSTASRSLRALGPPGLEWTSPPALGLVEPYLAKQDARSREVYLSAAGRKLRTRLDEIIARARPLRESGAQERATG